MRNLGQALKDRFAREDTYVCRCLVVKLTNGETYYITDLTRPVATLGQVFKPDPAIDVSAVRLSRQLGAQNAEILLGYNEQFDERRIRFGLLNDAMCELWYVDYRAPELGGALIMSGKISGVEQPSRTYAVLQMTSAIGAAQSTLYSEVYSKRCRNLFGDNRCKVDVNALSLPFTVIRTYLDRAQFAVNGYVDPSLPPEGAHIPRDNGQYIEVREGEHEFVVPDAQVLKLKLSSGGGGGATSGGRPYSSNGRPPSVTPGYMGNNAFDTYLERTSRGKLELLRLAGGSGGAAFPGAPGPASQPFILYDKPPRGAPGYFKGGAVVPTMSAATGGAGGTGAASGGGLSYTDGSTGAPEGQGGDGGTGAYVEYVFYLEDPACPIKAGDTLHLSIGAAGDSPDDGEPAGGPFSEGALNNTIQGGRGGSGKLELVWQSNVGEMPEPETFDLGTVLWLTGDNKGAVQAVAANTGGVIYLASSPRQPIVPGDTGLLRPGCSNFADMCENRWNNLINMRAEPATPQGATTMPTPIADTVQDATKPPARPGYEVQFPGGGPSGVPVAPAPGTGGGGGGTGGA